MTQTTRRQAPVVDVDAATEVGDQLGDEILRLLDRRATPLHQLAERGVDDPMSARAYAELGLGELFGREDDSATIIEGASALQAAGRGLALPRLLPEGVLTATAVRRLGPDLQGAGRRTAAMLRRPAAGALVTSAGGDVTVTARLPAVMLAAEADEMVLLVENPDGAVDVLLVPLDPVRRAGGLGPEPAMDPLRPSRTVTLERAVASHAGVLSPDDARRVESEWLVAVAADALGSMSACVDDAVRYASEREAFGRKIGTNQAVRHRIAEMFVATETARASVLETSVAVARAEPDSLDEALTCAAHTLSVFPDVTQQCLLVHGGIGFTWEGDVHFHVRRSFSASAVLGGPRELRSRLLRAA